MQPPPKEELLARAAQDADKINAALSSVNGGIPEAPEPPSDLVKLLGGFRHDGHLVNTATVRELNGLDEEALSKALKSNNIMHFMDTLITRGTETIGGEPADPKTLKSLLTGDRDELALQIRIATYGDTMTIDSWVCPVCEGVTPISFPLSEDVPRRTLKDPDEATFTVELRKGAKAKVRLPNGSDQAYLFEDPAFTTAQRNSRLLERCVISYIDKDGREYQVIARPSIVLELGITDRQKIVAEIANRSPGPQYNGIKFTHEACGNEVTLALGIADLFRDLLLFL